MNIKCKVGWHTWELKPDKYFKTDFKVWEWRECKHCHLLQCLRDCTAIDFDPCWHQPYTKLHREWQNFSLSTQSGHNLR